jgi:hypothetical protein
MRLSDIFDFPRKSFSGFYFPDRASWLPLALEALFWRVTGTMAFKTLLKDAGRADLLATGHGTSGRPE